MKTAFEYWKEKFGEEPQTDSERLAVAFAATYAEQAIDRCASKTGELFKDSDLDFLFEGVKKELK